MDNEINPKLSNVSKNLWMLFDKALCEKDFRWHLVNSPNEVLSEYGVTEENDIRIVKDLITTLGEFVRSRVECFAQGSNATKFKRANPNLTYFDAMEYKRTHTEDEDDRSSRENAS